MMFLYIFILFNIVEGIWPPTYKINLTNEEVFNIGEWNSKDEIISDEDEMIKKEDVNQMNLSEDDGRYKRLDEFIARFRKDTKGGKTNNWYIRNETRFRNEEPWELFLINNKRKKRYQVDSSLNNTAKEETSDEIKETVGDASNEIENYNYDDLRKEYDSELKEIAKLNVTFNSTNIETTENVKEVIKEIIDIKTPPKNCTKEKAKGFGINAVKCIVKDMKNANTTEEKKRLALIALKVLSIWIGIYIIIAMFFWCYKGWCCCCCYCKFCKPKNEIDEAKKFMLDNPPGVYHDANDEKIIYPYNQYEGYAYNELRDQLLSL